MRKLGKYNRIENYESGGKLETICKNNSYLIQNKDQLENNGDQKAKNICTNESTRKGIWVEYNCCTL